MIISLKQFWNFVSKFTKATDSLTQFQVECIHLNKHDYIANVFLSVSNLSAIFLHP